MTIRVGFSRATGFWSFLSQIIEWGIKRPYSHCWLLLEGEDAIRGIPMVLQESEGGGLHFSPYVGFGVGKVIVKIVDPPIYLGPGVDALINRLGTQYDYGGLVGEGLRLAFKDWFKRKIRNPLRNAHSMWCSEAVAFCINTVGYPNMKPNDWELCTPADVDDLLAGKSIES